MSRNAQAFKASLLALDGNVEDAAREIYSAPSALEGALMLAQIYREVDLPTAQKVEEQLKTVAKELAA